MDLSLITYHFILPMLQFCKEHLGSYGWAIIAVTVIIKVLLYPLTKHQTEAMQKLQALQPKIKIIQDRFNQAKERYKDKPEKLKTSQEGFQKDMIEFYQSHKVNPMGGCFPMLIQLPILIALFWAFNGSPFKPIAISVPIEVLDKEHTIYEHVKGVSQAAIYIGDKGEKARFVLNPGEVKIPTNKEVTYMILKLEGTIDGVPKNLDWKLTDRPFYSTSDVFKDVSKTAELKITDNTTVAIKPKEPGKFYLNAILPAKSENDDFLFINGLGKTGAIDPHTKKINWDVIVLVLLFGVTIWLSGKVSTGYSSPPADPQQAEMQKAMQRMMPAMVSVMTLLFPVPSGVLLYFVVSGVIQVLQTWLVMRKPVVIDSLNSEKKIESRV